jgi:predicted nucleic acid-binding protein
LKPRHIVVDANVVVSFLVDRNERQRTAAKALLERASDGEIVAVVPQFAIFEIAYVLQSFYAIPPGEVAAVLRELIALPGVETVDDCPWKRVFEYWPEQFSGLADAATAAVAAASGYDAIATFDQKMIRRMEQTGIASYW